MPGSTQTANLNGDYKVLDDHGDAGTYFDTIRIQPASRCDVRQHRPEPVPGARCLEPRLLPVPRLPIMGGAKRIEFRSEFFNAAELIQLGESARRKPRREQRQLRPDYTVGTGAGTPAPASARSGSACDSSSRPRGRRHDGATDAGGTSVSAGVFCTQASAGRVPESSLVVFSRTLRPRRVCILDTCRSARRGWRPAVASRASRPPLSRSRSSTHVDDVPRRVPRADRDARWRKPGPTRRTRPPRAVSACCCTPGSSSGGRRGRVRARASARAPLRVALSWRASSKTGWRTTGGGGPASGCPSRCRRRPSPRAGTADALLESGALDEARAAYRALAGSQRRAPRAYGLGRVPRSPRASSRCRTRADEAISCTPSSALPGPRGGSRCGVCGRRRGPRALARAHEFGTRWPACRIRSGGCRALRDDATAHLARGRGARAPTAMSRGQSASTRQQWRPTPRSRRRTSTLSRSTAARAVDQGRCRTTGRRPPRLRRRRDALQLRRCAGPAGPRGGRRGRVREGGRREPAARGGLEQPRSSCRSGQDASTRRSKRYRQAVDAAPADASIRFNLGAHADRQRPRR